MKLAPTQRVGEDAQALRQLVKSLTVLAGYPISVTGFEAII
jgi:hypothetical protein